LTQLNVKHTDEELDALLPYASRRQTPISWLVRDYLRYILRGGEPIAPLRDNELTSADLAAIAQHSRAFDWLEDEPDIYDPEDGDPI
jgi:hypothetical protein